MRRIESMEDDMRGQVTYEITPEMRITLNAADVRQYGLEALLKRYCVKIPQGRVPVFQDGMAIGSVPALFEPIAIKPTSLLYDVRPGDFKRTSDGWEAAGTLGPGDLDAVPGFQWSAPDRQRMQSASFQDERKMMTDIIFGKERS